MSVLYGSSKTLAYSHHIHYWQILTMVGFSHGGNVPGGHDHDDHYNHCDFCILSVIFLNLKSRFCKQSKSLSKIQKMCGSWSSWLNMATSLSSVDQNLSKNFDLCCGLFAFHLWRSSLLLPAGKEDCQKIHFPKTHCRKIHFTKIHFRKSI